MQGVQGQGSSHPRLSVSLTGPGRSVCLAAAGSRIFQLLQRPGTHRAAYAFPSGSESVNPKVVYLVPS